MPHMRNVTVQFAIPEDEPHYRLTDLRNELQDLLYDREGWAGSFQLVDVATYTDPTSDRAAGFFDEETRENDVKPLPVHVILETEAEENALNDRYDLTVLEGWAKGIASQAYDVEIVSLEEDAETVFRRLMNKGLIFNQNGSVRLTTSGFEAIGWGV